MATVEPRTPEQVQKDIEAERERLAGAVEHLRTELGAATDVTAKLKPKLPLLAGGVASLGFVLAGGVGATMRYLARRSRDGHDVASLGRWSLRD